MCLRHPTKNDNTAVKLRTCFEIQNGTNMVAKLNFKKNLHTLPFYTLHDHLCIRKCSYFGQLLPYSDTEHSGLDRSQ